KRSGRLRPVCQSSAVLKSPVNTRSTVIESVGSGVDSSGIRSDSVTRPAMDWSTQLTLLDQLKLPIRSGVPTRSDRVVRSCSGTTESTPPPGAGRTRGDSGLLSAWSTAKLAVGDQVRRRPKSRGFGLTDTDGNCWVMVP